MPEARAGYRMYPRGFVGGVPAPRVERLESPFAPLLSHHTYHINQFKPADTTTYANPDVEALYASFVNQSGTVASFEFRAKVLSVALHAFGTQDFDFWIREQRSSPASGELHRRFIHDMLRFLQGGRRELSLENWADILTIDDNGTDTTGPDRVVDDFFQWYPEAAKLPNVIQMWCRRPGGINDLLVTLHLLFGDF